jgi:histidinol-phosphatase
MTGQHPDLTAAFAFADRADEATLHWWRPEGVASMAKADGSPVTAADVAAEQAVLDALQSAFPEDGFLGEEVGARPGTTGRRWIVDGIDGTNYFAAGAPTWGTLIALEQEGEIVLGLVSSPAQHRRWWAVRGSGAHTARTGDTRGARIHVSSARTLRPDRVVTLPAPNDLAPEVLRVIDQLAGGRPAKGPWCQQLQVAQGDVDACIWYAGDTWDHAAPSIIVEEAGGRFTDHAGGRRLDTRTAVYSNGAAHDAILAALTGIGPGVNA